MTAFFCIRTKYIGRPKVAPTQITHFHYHVGANSVRPLAFAVNVFYTDVLCDTAQGEFLLCGIAVYKKWGGQDKFASGKR